MYSSSVSPPNKSQKTENWTHQHGNAWFAAACMNTVNPPHRPSKFKTTSPKVYCFLKKLWKGFWYTQANIRKHMYTLSCNEIKFGLNRRKSCGKCSIFYEPCWHIPLAKVPSLTTIIMHFDAVLIRESSFNIYFKRFFLYQAIFCHFMNIIYIRIQMPVLCPTST